MCKKCPNLHCERSACRRHCALLGGCSVKEHEPAAELNLSLELREPSPGSAPPAEPSDSSPGLEAGPSCPEPPAEPSNSSPGLEAGPSRTLQPHDPGCEALEDALAIQLPLTLDKGKGKERDTGATQLPVLFTIQHTQEEEIGEARHHADLSYLEAAERARNSVIDDTCPVLYEFQEGFKLPNFRFSQTVLLKLGLPDCNVQRYNTLLQEWIRFDIGHSIRLEDCDGQVLLVKATPVERCLHLDHHLRKIAHPQSPNIANSRKEEHKYIRAPSRPPSELLSPPLDTNPYNSNHEFLYVSSPQPSQPHVPSIQETKAGASRPRPAAKRIRSESIISLTDSNSSTEGVISQRTLKGKGREWDPDSTSSSQDSLTPSESESSASPVIIPSKRHQRIRCLPRTPPSDSGNLSPSPSPSWATPAQTTSSSVQPFIKKESSGSLLSHGGSKDNAIEVEKVHTWPIDFYTCNINDCFKQCKIVARSNSSKSVASVFREFFGTPFISSTFYDNRRIWDYDGNRTLCERCINYGRHDKGTWSAFMVKAKRPPRA
ncbi:hypothetical protein BDN67DRAFT_1016908 [Paxillus ammoniavirescens]|nr:hypothetical protein BDN67DRAFT_1016908 [Paxillus ammoniavirescens]